MFAWIDWWGWCVVVCRVSNRIVLAGCVVYNRYFWIYLCFTLNNKILSYWLYFVYLAYERVLPSHSHDKPLRGVDIVILFIDGGLNTFLGRNWNSWCYELVSKIEDYGLGWDWKIWAKLSLFYWLDWKRELGFAESLDFFASKAGAKLRLYIFFSFWLF